MPRFSLSIAPLLLVLLSSAVQAQVTFVAPSGSMTIGTTQTFPMTIDSSDQIAGFSYGLCPSGPSPVSVTVTAPGSLFDSIGQPDFYTEAIEPGGVVGSHVIGCVFDLLGVTAIPPGIDLEIIDVTFVASAPGSIDLCFCDTLGAPPVTTLYIDSGVSLVPNQVCGTITVNGLCSPVDNVTCTLENGVQVAIEWDNPQSYSSHSVYRNGVLIGTIPGDDNSFVDTSPATNNLYEIESTCVAGGPEIATCSIQLQSAGDANGDGNIDLGDAIYLLNYLVGAGSPPVFVDCP